MTDPWLTVYEAAAHLHLHPDTLRKLAQAGRITACKAGDGPRSPWRFRASELDAWMERGRLYPLDPRRTGPAVRGSRRTGATGQRSAS